MRFWLIGNGPSLNDTPLDLLAGEYTMAVNKISGIFHKTKWRPTHYVKIDYSPFDGGKWKDEVMPFVESGIPCLLWDVFRDGVKDPNEPFGDLIPDGIGDYPNVTWVTRCKHHAIPPKMNGCAKKWHNPFCTAYNSINTMAQWAVKLGATEIYLLGCDGKFTNGRDDHFMPYYNQIDAGYVERNNSHVLAAQLLIKESCPVPVYDFTMGGGLEVFGV